ncbi:hypothetical protein HRW12_00675 [Streptomyces lunaelactis]|uniref:hypothetical protein n=1 Tax=Streptomyces lunaelactis TaxID=1535768 RepID=UPI001584594E|nr:hypothetical protein [Streptomyces lunaelactis]NUK32312.1 hypothetical protein [Streptomyces lunaelactis]NUK40342.1 hypothetical protein [Streptomyces lunaelactis]
MSPGGQNAQQPPGALGVGRVRSVGVLVLVVPVGLQDGVLTGYAFGVTGVVVLDEEGEVRAYGDPVLGDRLGERVGDDVGLDEAVLPVQDVAQHGRHQLPPARPGAVQHLLDGQADPRPVLAGDGRQSVGEDTVYDGQRQEGARGLEEVEPGVAAANLFADAARSATGASVAGASGGAHRVSSAAGTIRATANGKTSSRTSA